MKNIFEIADVTILVVAGAMAIFAFKAKYNTPQSRKWWGYFLFLGVFVFAEKILEVVGFYSSNEIFTMIEAIAGMFAGIIAVIVSFIGYRRYVVD